MKTDSTDKDDSTDSVSMAERQRKRLSLAQHLSWFGKGSGSNSQESVENEEVIEEIEMRSQPIINLG